MAWKVFIHTHSVEQTLGGRKSKTVFLMYAILNPCHKGNLAHKRQHHNKNSNLIVFSMVLSIYSSKINIMELDTVCVLVNQSITKKRRKKKFWIHPTYNFASYSSINY